MTRLVRVAILLWISLKFWTAGGQTGEHDDFRYLVIRRGGRPEKNYYELAKQVSLFDGEVVTREPAGIRYGVHSIWKVRVQRVTDSQKDPASLKDAYYVLIYERDPDKRFCAVHYDISALPPGARRIAYTDCEDKKQYSFEMTQLWPRPFVIYEVDVLERDVLRGLWERQKHDRNSRQSGVF